MNVDLHTLEDWTKPDNSENYPSNDQTFQTLSVIFQMKMESMCKILEIILPAIYPVRFRRYPDKDCIFILSDIMNHQLKESEWEVTNEN